MSLPELIKKAGYDLAQERKDIQEEIAEMQAVLFDDRKLLLYIVEDELDELENKKSKKANDRRAVLVSIQEALGN